MDVQKFNFPAKLLDILTAISEAHFVAFDLELSGVPVRPFGTQDRGKATLQARYAETKAAAERYSILQVGLTCVAEDAMAGEYILKPYNIHISPLIIEKLDLDRDFAFHSGAVEFLNSVGFNFQAPLAIGVPYLSASEAALARRRTDERLKRTNDSHRPMEFKPHETESIALMGRVRKRVKAWVDALDLDHDVLYLGPRELAVPSAVEPGPGAQLSRFEKRLVHEVVRGEFPDLLSTAMGGGVQVLRQDPERERRHRKSKMREVDERIQRQKGFSWIVDALAGRSLAKLDPGYFNIRLDEGGGTSTQGRVSFDSKSMFDRAKSLLQGRPTPIVGHNLFLDLVYLYRHFVDDLPDTVEEFQAKVHALFPTVIDTKYLATHECGDINPMSSLQSLAQQLDRQEKPVITIDDKHDKYKDFAADHEAGFDSMLTAQVAIRLSAKLEAEKRTNELSDGEAEETSEEVQEDDVVGGVQLDSAEDNGHAQEPVAASPVKTSLSRFAHTTPFDGLQDEGEGDDEVLDFDALPTDEVGAATTGDNDAWVHNIPVVGRPAALDAAANIKWSPYRLIPRWKAELWTEYSNRLRVFGTQESMCVLDR